MSLVLRRGAPAPRQSTPTTCGSSCLVVARMLADPAYAERVGSGGFAAEERRMPLLTNRIRPWGRVLQLPWPRSLGTPPWGAAAVLARVLGLGRRGVRRQVVRWSSPATRTAVLDGLSPGVRSGRCALVYVGSRWLPRHVVLLVPPADGVGVDVYEPAAGQVLPLDTDDFVRGLTTLAGWTRVWLVVAAAEDLP
ncbi:hypothetical protein [Arsenicicoccus dermatophilus]|uniref:hypothetical protein n=1 Tax=Arsenicicoccus dermatophilus TaxID=1076331 RepID=UPI001F4C63D2|nr:hypothetical protein [Arsenicicoccus dermatophilus]MCH8613385.1 hypothetical protein [Arsenicicoccus dermatophilus]